MAPNLRTLDLPLALAIRERATTIIRNTPGIVTMAEAIDRAWAEHLAGKLRR